MINVIQLREFLMQFNFSAGRSELSTGSCCHCIVN